MEKRLITIYLFVLFVLLFFLAILQHLVTMPGWYGDDLLFFQCGYIGALGGTLYCTIALWRHASSEDWMGKWTLWYVFRPIGGAVTGLISFLALKGGLLVLSSSTQTKDNTFYIFLLVAFIAGYRMGSFMKKIENVVLPPENSNASGKAPRDD